MKLSFRILGDFSACIFNLNQSIIKLLRVQKTSLVNGRQGCIYLKNLAIYSLSQNFLNVRFAFLNSVQHWSHYQIDRFRLFPAFDCSMSKFSKACRIPDKCFLQVHGTLGSCFRQMGLKK